MARPRVEVGLGVVLWPLIFVFDKQCDGRAERNRVFNPGLDVDKIFLIPLRE